MTEQKSNPAEQPRSGITIDSEVTFPASVSQLDKLLEGLTDRLHGCGVVPAVCTRVAVGAEEVFVNIATYAYGPPGGSVHITLHVDDGECRLQFEDNGAPFNPLEQPAPDTSSELDKRKIGGLGIFLTRKMMDDVVYERKNDKNILTLVKKLNCTEKSAHG